MKSVLLLLFVAGCSALPSALNFGNASRMAAIYGDYAGNTSLAGAPWARPAAEATDCHKWDWFYCPRDPGCTTYKMSAHQVSISKLQQPRMVVGKWVNLYVIGVTTIKSVAEIASYKVYGIKGGNVASGVLAARPGMWNDGPKGKGASLELNFKKRAGEFRLQIPLVLTADSFDETGKLVNFGIDIFLANRASEEGMCVQLANAAYSQMESKKAPFEMECKDNGDGTFTPGKNPNALHPLSGCNEFHKQCDGCLTTCNPQRAAFLVDRNPFALQ